MGVFTFVIFTFVTFRSSFWQYSFNAAYTLLIHVFIF
jgi:hypothetical protein